MARAQITQAEESSSLSVDEAAEVLVYVRQEIKNDGSRIRGAWSGDAQTSSGSVGWIAADYLEPITAVDCCGPAIPYARFDFKYGNIKREDKSSFTTYSAQDLYDSFVKIVLLKNEEKQNIWYGIIGPDTKAPHGKDTSPDGTAESGDQTLTAYGLGSLLETQFITTAQTDDGEINRVPTFNTLAQNGGHILGNRSSTRKDGDANKPYVFSDDGEVWSNYDILEYLLYYHSPADMSIWLNDNTGTSSDGNRSLENIKTVHHIENYSLSAAINTLVDRRRSLVWHISHYDDDIYNSGAIVSLNIDLAVEKVSLGNGLVSKNEKSAVIDLSENKKARYTIERVSAPRYDEIHAVGERALTCFSVSFSDSNLIADWTSALETTYDDLFSGSDADDNEEKACDPRFVRVYNAFRIPASWDGTAGLSSGTTSDDYSNVYFAFDDDGTINTASGTLWGGDKTFERFLPLHVGERYDQESDNENPENSATQFLPPIVFVKDADNKYVNVSNLRDTAAASNGQIIMYDNGLGLYVQTTPNYMLGKNGFSGTNYNDEALYNYSTMVATVAMRTDERLRVVRKISAKNQDSPRALSTAQTRKLVIPVSGAEYWYVTPGTVTGIDTADRQLLRYSSSRDNAVRDDSEKLMVVAALATSWYSHIRRAVSIEYTELGMYMALGTMIQKVASGLGEEISTILTKKRWDFDTMQTTLSTSFADIAFVDASGVNDPDMPDASTMARRIKQQSSDIRQIRDRTGNLPVRGYL